MQNKILKITAKILVFIFILIASFFQYAALPVNADGALADMSDIFERLKVNTASNQIVEFTATNGVINGDVMSITYPTDEFSGFGKFDLGEDDVEVKNITADHVYTDAANCDGTEEIYVNVMKDNINLYFCSGDGGSVSSGDVIRVYIGAFTDETVEDGNYKLTNPLVAGTKVINLYTGPSGMGMNPPDRGALAVYIVDDDQVDITATVDPTFTFTLAGTDCDLGSLSPTTLDACIVTSTVSTNAVLGYTATLLDDDALGFRTAGGDSIDDTGADSTIDADGALEQFGISTEDSGVDIAEYTTNGGEIDAAQCGLDKTSDIAVFDPITTTEQTYASYDGPIINNEIELCIAAHSIATTEAGIYNDTITFIATGKF